MVVRKGKRKQFWGMDVYSVRSAKNINSIRIFLFFLYVAGIIGALGSLRKEQLALMVISTSLYGVSSALQAYRLRKNLDPHAFYFTLGDVFLLSFNTLGQQMIDLDIASGALKLGINYVISFL